MSRHLLAIRIGITFLIGLLCSSAWAQEKPSKYTEEAERLRSVLKNAPGLLSDSALVSIARVAIAEAEAKEMKKPSRGDYTVGLGGSFDVLDGIVSDVYFDVDVLVPHIGASTDAAWWSRLKSERAKDNKKGFRPLIGIPEGVSVGFFRGTTPVQSDSIQRPAEYYLFESQVGEQYGDSLRLVRTNTTRTLRREHDILGARFSSLRMFAPNVGWVLHGELRRRNATEVFLESSMAPDTVSVPRSTKRDDVRFGAQSDTLRFQSTVYNGYLGGGLLFRLNDSAIDLRVQPVVAYSPRHATGSKAHFIVHFSARENTLGLSFGGNIRGAFDGTEPDLILYISKKFELGKLSEKIKFG